MIRDTVHFHRQIQKGIAGKTSVGGKQSSGDRAALTAHSGENRQGNGQRTAAEAGQVMNGSNAGCGQIDPSFPCVNNTSSLYRGNTSCSRGKTVLYSMRSNMRYAPVMELVDMRDLGDVTSV